MNIKIRHFSFSVRHSFTIIELAIGLVISGILLSGGVAAYRASNPKMRSDLQKMQKIEDALQQFFTTNGRLPYPAHPSDVNGSSNYLSESTTYIKYSATSSNSKAIWGVVPTRTLGLSD